MESAKMVYLGLALLLCLLFPLGSLFTKQMIHKYGIHFPVLQNLIPFAILMLILTPFALFKLFKKKIPLVRLRNLLAMYAIVGLLEAHIAMGISYALRHTTMLAVCVIFNAWPLLTYAEARNIRTSWWKLGLLAVKAIALVIWLISDHYQENDTYFRTEQIYQSKRVFPLTGKLAGDLLVVACLVMRGLWAFLRKDLMRRSGKVITMGLSVPFAFLTTLIYFLVFELDAAKAFFTKEKMDYDPNLHALYYFLGYIAAFVLFKIMLAYFQVNVKNHFYGVIIFFGTIQALIYQFTIFDFSWNAGHIVALVLFLKTAILQFFPPTRYADITEGTVLIPNA